MQYSRHCEPFAHPDTNQAFAVKQAKGEAIFSVIKNLNEEIAAPISADFDLVGVESGGDGFAMTFSDKLRCNSVSYALSEVLTDCSTYPT